LKRILLNLLLVHVLVPAAVSWSQGTTGPHREGRLLKLEELAFPDVQNLDRNKTIFVLRFSIMEEHGPHLPIGTDWFHDIAFEDRLIAHLRSAHPDYDIVLVAPMPLGEAGANDIAGHFEHPGSFTVRFKTLRAVALDMGATIARKGFKFIFVVAGHGMPLYSEAINEASDFVSDHYHAQMVNLSSLVEGERDYFIENGHVKERDDNSPAFDDLVYRKRFGMVDPGYIDAHAGINETSMILYCRPALVKPSYKDLPIFKTKEMREAQARPDWQGYWGAPSLATASFGKELIDVEMQQYVRFAEMALRDEDLSKLPRWPLSKDLSDDTTRKERELYDSQEREFDNWLAAHHLN
jgi:creatinine amidohydrolase